VTAPRRVGRRRPREVSVLGSRAAPFGPARGARDAALRDRPGRRRHPRSRGARPPRLTGRLDHLPRRRAEPAGRRLDPGRRLGASVRRARRRGGVTAGFSVIHMNGPNLSSAIAALALPLGKVDAGMVALPLLEGGVPVVDAEAPRGEPPLHQPPDPRAVAPAVGVARAHLPARVVNPTQKRDCHGADHTPALGLRSLFKQTEGVQHPTSKDLVEDV
jgi:hypothetical protein